MLLEPVRSIIDFPFYHEIPQKSFLRVVSYLIYVGLVYSVLFVAAAYMRIDPVVQDMAQWLSTSMPPVTIADGKATSNLTAPLLLHNPKYGQFSILIDTNRTTPVTFEELQKANVEICLTQTSIYIMNNQKSTLEERPLAAIKTTRPFVIDGDFLIKFAKYFSRLMYAAGFIFLWIGFVLLRLVISLFYALVGLGINASIAAELDFASIYKLAVYAQTPMILLRLVVVLLGRPLPTYVSLPLGLLVTSAYIWQAIRQNKTPTAVA